MKNKKRFQKLRSKTYVSERIDLDSPEALALFDDLEAAGIPLIALGGTDDDDCPLCRMLAEEGKESDLH